MENNGIMTLFTQEHIEVLGAKTFLEPIDIKKEGIAWYCLLVDKNNLIKALKSIKINGTTETEIKTDQDRFNLVFDYTSVKESESEKYLMVIFDDYEEQFMDLIYKLEDGEDASTIQSQIFEKLIK